MKLEVDIACPGCEHKFKVALAKMKPGSCCTCPGCNEQITFRGDDASKVQDTIDEAIGGLERAVRDANRRIRG